MFCFLKQLYETFLMKISKDVMICSLFICNYTSSFITPIQLLVVETYHTSSPLSFILQFMDLFMLLIVITQQYYKSLNFMTRFETISMIASTSITLIISIVLVFNNSTSILSMFYTLEYIRWLKIMYLPMQYNRISQVKQESFHYLYENIDTFLSFILVMLLYISTMACIWYGVASYQMMIYCNDDIDTWITYDEVLNIQSNVSRYFRSLHFITQTLLGIGYGDIYPRNTIEILLTVFMILISILFYGYLISLIICILTDKDQVTKIIGYKLSLVKQYLNKHCIQTTSKSDIISYYRYINTQYDGISSEECLLKLLPQQLMFEIKNQDCSKQVLLQIPFFQLLVPNSDKLSRVIVDDNIVHRDINATILSHIVMKLNIQLLHPSFHITNKYQSSPSARRLLIVRKGCIDVCSFYGAIQDTIRSKYAGDCIGEQLFLLGLNSPNHYNNINKNNALEAQQQQIYSQDIIARSFSEVAVLSYSDFIACLIDCKYITSELQYQNLVHEVTSASLESEGINTSKEPHNHPPLVTDNVIQACNDLNYQQLRNALLGYYHSLPTCNISHNSNISSSNCSYHHIPDSLLPQQQTTKEGEQHYNEISSSFSKRFEHSNLMWWILICIIIFYYNIAIPVRIMLEYDETYLQSQSTTTTHFIESSSSNHVHHYSSSSSTWNYFYAFDYFGDFIFMLEVLYHTWYRNDRISNVSDGNKLNNCQYYTLLCIILPIDWLSIYSKGGSLVYYRISKIFSIFLLPCYVNNIKHWFDIVQGKIMNPELITLFYLATCNLIAMAWITAGWNMLQIQTFLDNNVEADDNNNCITAATLVPNKIFTLCISSLYWCLTTVTTTGYGDIIPLTTAQTIFNVFITIIGPSIFVTIIAKLVSYIKREDNLENNAAHRTTALLQFLQHLNIPYTSPSIVSSNNVGDTFNIASSGDRIKSELNTPQPQSHSAKIKKIVKFHRNDLQINTETFQYSNTNKIPINTSCKLNARNQSKREYFKHHFTIIKPSNLLHCAIPALKPKIPYIKADNMPTNHCPILNEVGLKSNSLEDAEIADEDIFLVEKTITVKRLNTKYYPWLIPNPNNISNRTSNNHRNRIKPIFTSLNSTVQLRIQSKPTTTATAVRVPVRLKNMMKTSVTTTTTSSTSTTALTTSGSSSYEKTQSNLKHVVVGNNNNTIKISSSPISSPKNPKVVVLRKEVSLVQRIQKKWSSSIFNINKDEIVIAPQTTTSNQSIKEAEDQSTMMTLSTKKSPFNLSFQSSFNNNIKKTSSYMKQIDQKFTNLKSALSFRIPDIPHNSFSTITNVSIQLYQIAKDSLELFSQKHRIEQAVVEYYQYLARIGISTVEEFAMPFEQSVHNNIRFLSRYAILYETIHKIKLFMNFDAYLIQGILNAMEQQFYCKSTVIDKHQAIYGLYVIQKGNIYITHYHKVNTSTTSYSDYVCDHSKYYQAKDYFGESSLLSEKESSYSLEVTAQDDCELWFLSRHRFHALLQQHPKKHEILHAMKQTTVLLKLGVPGIIPENDTTSTSIDDEEVSCTQFDNATIGSSFRMIYDDGDASTKLSELEEEQVINVSSSSYKRLGRCYWFFGGIDVSKRWMYVIQLLHSYIVQQSIGIVWSILMAFFIIYNAFVLILRICFFQSCSISYYYAIDYLADVFFLLDTIAVARWSTSYLSNPASSSSYNKQSQEHVDNNISEKNIVEYRKVNQNQFIYYVISIIPFDLFIFMNSAILTLGPSQTLSVYRLNRLVRSLDLNIHFNLIANQIIQTCDHFIPSSTFNLSSTIFPIIKVFAITFITAHFFGSIFFLLANQQHLAGELDNWGDAALLFSPVQCAQTANTTTTTLAIQQVCDYNWKASTNDVINQYVHSLYWAITLLTTTGYGDIHPISNIEKGYNIILYILGIMVYTLLVAYLQEIMSGWNITYELFKQRMETIHVVLYDELLNTTKQQQQPLTEEYIDSTTNTYDEINDDDDDNDDINDSDIDDDNINEINVIKNKSLVSDVKRYYDHLWIMQRGLMHYEIQEYMPNRLYSATLLHIFSKQMRSLFFIQQCSLEFQYAFLNKLKVHYYMQGDYIFHTGEVARSLYLLHTGDVTLISSEVNTEVRPTDNTPYHSDISTSRSSTRKYSGYSTKRVNRSTDIHKSNAIFPILPHETKYVNVKPRNISKVSHKTISVNQNGTSSRSSVNKHRTSINRLSNRISRINKSIHKLSRFSHLKRHLSRLNHSKSTCYKTISEGSCIGTAEFFLKNVYTCTAKVATTTTTADTNISVGGKDTVCTFEIEYDEFYQLLVDFKLERFYQQVLEQNEIKLHKHSTLAIVSKLNLNLNQLRLKKLLTLRLPSIPVIECYSENHIIYQIWNTVMLIVITMVAIWIPYYMAFAKSYQVKWQLVIDILVIAIYWIDIYLRMFILSYLDGQISSSIKEPSLVHKTYIRSSFLLDLISAIPFSLVVYAIFANTFAYSIVRYIILIRIYRLPQLIYSLLKTRTKQIIQLINEDLQRLFCIVSVFVYTTHLTSCILCYLGKIEITYYYSSSYYYHCSHRLNNTPTCATSWITVNGLSSAANSRVYLYAYYWTLYTLSSVGYGSLATQSNIERIYLLCIMIIGSLLCAMVSAIITSILEKNIQKKGDLRRNLYSIIKYCNSKKIDNTLQTKIRSYYQYIQSQGTIKKIYDNKEFLLLPYIIRFKIIHLYYWNNIKNHCYLNSNYFDKSLQRGFLLSMIRVLSLYTSIPGEIINKIDFNIHVYYNNQIENNWINIEDSYQIDKLLILRRGLCYTSACSSQAEIYLKYLCPIKHILDYKNILNELNVDKVEYDQYHNHNYDNTSNNNIDNNSNNDINNNDSNNNDNSKNDNNNDSNNNDKDNNICSNNLYKLDQRTHKCIYIRNKYHKISKLIAISESYCHFYYVSKENLLGIKEFYKKSLFPISKR